MSNRKLLLLSAIFLGLLLFVALYERNQPTSEDAESAKKRLIDFKSGNVVGVLLERPELPKVDLRKSPDGRWTLAADPPGAADGPAADAIVSDLGRLEVVGETQTKVDPKEYGLDVPKAKVTLTFKDGSRHTIAFGLPIPGTDATAAAEGERFGAVKFAPLASLTKPLSEYRSRSLLDTPVSEVTRVTVVNGPNRVIVSRETLPDKTMGPWRIEVPVADLASESFVERLLGDLASSRVSEFPAVAPSDLPRIGLQPPNAVVTVQKGAELVSNVSFGAAKADTTGKIYARDGQLVMVVDDRVAEDLGKEFSAFRESRVAPVEPFLVRRVTFDSDDLRVGVERVEGEWRSKGRVVPSTLVENLAGRISRADGKGFVSPKDYSARGIPAGKQIKPLATVEILQEKEAVPRTLRFLPAAPGGDSLVAVEVSGRPDAILVENTLLDELRADAKRIADATKDVPTGPVKAAPAKPKEAPKESEGKVVRPAKPTP
jgi:hypothetical protein